MDRDLRYIEDLLIEKVLQGDHKAFEELYFMYSEQLYGFALRYLKTKEDAEGLVQEIFIKIWETRSRLKKGQSFGAYLFTIAKNTIFNQFRKKVNEKAYLEYLRNHLDNRYNKTENDVILNDIRKQIEDCIETLPPQRKLVFQMSRFKGLSHKEIAKELDISEKTVETHIRLALKTIRARFKSDMLLTAFLSLPLFI